MPEIIFTLEKPFPNANMLYNLLFLHMRNKTPREINSAQLYKQIQDQIEFTEKEFILKVNEPLDEDFIKYTYATCNALYTVKNDIIITNGPNIHKVGTSNEKTSNSRSRSNAIQHKNDIEQTLLNIITTEQNTRREEKNSSNSNY